MARPGRYESDVKPRLIEAEAWARDGLTLAQIAHNLGIAEKTLYDYKRQYSEFSQALKKGKEVVDIEVENSLLKRAHGYEYREVTEELMDVIDEQGNRQKRLVVTKVVTKQVAPDVTAEIFWLKNRKPNDWRDKHDIEHSGGVNITLEGAVKEWAK